MKDKNIEVNQGTSMAVEREGGIVFNPRDCKAIGIYGGEVATFNPLPETYTVTGIKEDMPPSKSDPVYQPSPSALSNQGLKEIDLKDPEETIDSLKGRLINETPYVKIGQEIGQLVGEKQEAYGDSFGRSGNVLREMYPDGIKPEQYDDMLCLVRVVDKLFRIANKKDAFGESPYRDLTGYGILGTVRDERNKKESK